MISGILSLLSVVIAAGLAWWAWGPQRRWELKRDATLDAIRSLADLEDAVTNLDTALKQPEGILTEEAQTAIRNLQLDAMQQFGKRCTAYKRAHIVADLAVGGKLSRRLSDYFQFALPLVRQGLSSRRPFLQSAQKKELALRGNAAIMSAREALGIKSAGDLPLLDEPN
jgi:hypothetical protein